MNKKSSLMIYLCAVAFVAACCYMLAEGTTNIVGSATMFFVLAAILPAGVSALPIKSEWRSLIYLGCAYLATSTLGAAEGAYSPLCEGALAGLLTWKVSHTLVGGEAVDDSLPALVWLTAFYATNCSSFSISGEVCRRLTITVLLIALVLKFAESLLLKNDKDPQSVTAYSKRMALAVSGGLATLIVISKVLLADKLSLYAAVFGVGLALAYLLPAPDTKTGDQTAGQEGAKLSQCLQSILLVGIATLAVTRLDGMPGLLVLAAAALAPNINGIVKSAAPLACLFWTSRVLLQSFIVQYNPNVTGVNLLHSYASAALYAGFVIVVLAALLIGRMENRRLLFVGILCAAILAPLSSNYFLHSEPTGAFLVSVLVATVLTAMLAPVMLGTANYSRQGVGDQAVMLIPPAMTVFALTSARLIELGAEADINARLCWLVYLTAFLTVIPLGVQLIRILKPKAHDAQVT